MMEQRYSALEFRQLAPEWGAALAVFLHTLEASGDTKYFHPHPFSDDVLGKLCNYHGEDLYYVAVESNQVIAYGILRGWDEKYIVPSLGIAIHPDARGTGLAKAFMYFLHMAARRKGSLQIRLKVYPDNIRAITLYEELGYVFQEMDDKQMVGRLTFK